MIERRLPRRPGVVRAPRALSLLAFLLLLCPATVSAQEKVELKGLVVEMGTSRPLAGAEVGLPALDRWTLTDREGAFAIGGLPAGRHRVEVTYLGYRKHEGDLVIGPDAVRLELWPDPIVLAGLTAQVDRLRSRRNAVATTVRVADRDRLTGAATIEDAIRRTGEMLVPCASTDYCLWRRGQTVRPVVYIDERPAFGLHELSAYPVERFQMIEVIGHRMIRAYTVDFMERLALGKVSLFPLFF